MPVRSRFWLVALVLTGWGSAPCVFAETVSNAVQDSMVSLRVISEFGAVSLEMIEQLRQELWMVVPVRKQEGDEVLLLSPAEVIAERRKYPEMAVLAGNKMCSIQRLTLGAAPELIAVGDRYVDFFEGVVQGAWTVTLTQRLRRADAALKKLARQTLARKIYLDEFEKRSGESQLDGTAAGDGMGGIPGLEKSRIDLYLDWAEKEFVTP